MVPYSSLSESALSATPIKRMPHSRNLSFMYCSITRISREKSGLIFAEHNIDFSSFTVVEQAIEGRTGTVNAAVTVITIDVVNFPVSFLAIIPQHFFLILYTLTVVCFLLVFVLYRQTAVNSNFRYGLHLLANSFS